MPVVTEERRKRIVPPPIGPDGGGGDDSPGGSRPSFPVTPGQIGLWVLLTAIIMLFAGLSSAFIILRGTPGWQNITIPSLLWGNTVVLVGSSVAIEFARRSVRKNQISAMNQWLVAGGVLGLAFLAGQILAWRQLVNAGVYLPSTLHGSFFYVLTGTHALHLTGGVVALALVLARARKGQLTVFHHEPLRLCATYWHFMDALWIYLFLILILA